MPLTEFEAHQHYMPVNNVKTMQKFSKVHSSILLRRKSVGIHTPVVGIGRGSTKKINGNVGFALGFVYGLQWNEHVQGICYQSLDSSVLVFDEILKYFSYIWIPENWSNAMLAYRDSIDIIAAVYANCDTEALLLTFSGLASREGTSTFLTRILMSAFYDLADIYEEYKDEEYDFGRGEQVAKAFALIFNFQIQ